MLNKYYSIFFVCFSLLFRAYSDTRGSSIGIFLTANLRDTVTLHCGVYEESIFILNWFKQSLGIIPQVVANRIDEKKNYPSFNSRITVGVGTDYNLRIRDIKNKDEANFFYNQVNQYIRIFGKSANFWPSKVTYSFQHFACLGHKQKYILSNLIMQQLII